MTYSFTVEDIRGKQSSSNSNDSLSYKDELRIEYSTGQIQVIIYIYAMTKSILIVRACQVDYGSKKVQV